MNAVAKPNPGAEIAIAEQQPVERALTLMEEKFSAALPAHIPAKRFVRAALSACANPDIRALAATAHGRKSIFDGCLKAASDGLLLDGREAALVKFGDKAQYMPMVAGIMKKVRNSGEISSLVCQCVYSNDTFEIDYVTADAPVVHRPDLANRGELMGVYAVARYKDGTWSQPEYMSVAEVQAIRKRSRASGSGPWVTDFAEMARKTAIRRLAKYLPSSTDRDGFQDAVRRDDQMYEADETATPVAANAQMSTLKKIGAAKALLAAAPESDEPAEAETHDPETGEIAAADAAAT